MSYIQEKTVLIKLEETNDKKQIQKLLGESENVEMTERILTSDEYVADQFSIEDEPSTSFYNNDVPAVTIGVDNVSQELSASTDDIAEEFVEILRAKVHIWNGLKFLLLNKLLTVLLFCVFANFFFRGQRQACLLTLKQTKRLLNVL